MPLPVSSSKTGTTGSARGGRGEEGEGDEGARIIRTSGARWCRRRRSGPVRARARSRRGNGCRRRAATAPPPRPRPRSREGAGGQAVVDMGGVLEGEALAEEAGEHRGGGAGLGAVAAGIFREGRGDQQRLPVGVDEAVDVGDGAQQVVAELRMPAGDEGIRHGDAEQREHLDPAVERRILGIEDLAGDRDPVAGRGGREHRVVGPEARGDQALVLGEVARRLPDLQRLGMEGGGGLSL
jgi:hypothetical protein